MGKYAIAIHGGAGTLLRSVITPQTETMYKKALQEALQEAETILQQGGRALDAAQTAVVSLENCPLFNAGRGSVFNHEGKHEMDASIMDGLSLEAGAVSGLSGFRNPIVVARAVMEQTEHVFLSGKGAMAFASSIGLQAEPDEYFFVQHRYDQYLGAFAEGKVMLDHTSEKKFGTVGAVALDRSGNLAAATSTGGMTNKKYGRIGDSPLIGAGTYANNKTCAVSCTGHGEFFIRSVVAYDISCLMEYKGLSLKQACEKVVNDKLVKLGGGGGLIALDAGGNVCMPFNSEGMYRGMIKEGEEMYLGIYSE